MNKHVVFFAAGLGALSLFGLGCNPFQAAQDKVSQKIGDSVASGILSQAAGGKVDVNSEGGNYTFTDNKTGASYAVGENVKIPDGFPKEIPLYPGAKTLTVEMGQVAKGEASVTQQSKDDPQTVMKWLADQLKDWKQTSTASFNGSEMRAYEKGTTSMNVTVIQGNGPEKGSVITMTRQEKTEN